MPWLEATPMDHRLQFVAEARRTDESFTALCARFGIAPKTGYKWLARYEAEGPAGLHERARRPHTSPTAPPVTAVRLTTSGRPIYRVDAAPQMATTASLAMIPPALDTISR